MAHDGVSLRLRQSIILNDLPLVRRILKSNPHLLYNPVHSDKANTSLHLAASYGHFTIAEYLIHLGHDSNYPSSNDICCDITLSHGISVNTDGQTPLHLAAANLHTPVVELLCRTFPSTINRRDQLGRTPLLLAAGAQARSITPISTVSLSKSIVRAAEDVSTLSVLLEYDADVTSKDLRGNICLHNACAFGNLKAIRALIQAGADPAHENFEGWKPELYSLTVQAEVYYRNLVNEFGKRKAEEARLLLEKRGKTGSVRLVTQDEEDSDSTNSPTGRSRADSGQSQSTFESAMS